MRKLVKDDKEETDAMESDVLGSGGMGLINSLREEVKQVLFHLTTPTSQTMVPVYVQ